MTATFLPFSQRNFQWSQNRLLRRLKALTDLGHDFAKITDPSRAELLIYRRDLFTLFEALHDSRDETINLCVHKTARLYIAARRANTPGAASCAITS